MPTGKQTLAQFGATVKAKHPEYADLPDDQVGSKVLAKYPEYGDMVDTAPDHTKPPAHPFASPAASAADIINAGPTTRTGTLIQGIESSPSGQHEDAPGLRTLSPRHLLHEVGAGVGDTITGLYHEFDDKGSFNDPTRGMTPEQKLQYHADTVADQGERQTKSFMADPGGAYASHVGEQLPGLILGGAAHAAAPAVAEGAASTLNAGGRLLRKTGAVASKLAVGAPAAIDSLGADAGAALSRNRIVAASKPSLLRKTQAKVGPAAEARDTILRNSPAAPVDVTPLTQAPFDEISDVKTDPKTGVVNPQGMSKANLMRRAVQEVADPQTGAPTGTPKDLTLAPHEMGELQRNVYDATDYDSADSDLANQYLKGTGAKLKGAIDVAVPEARTATQNVHDLLGAKEHLKATAPGPTKASDFAPGKILGKVYDAARVGGGTAAGAGLDVAGSGLQKAGGALRSLISAGSPVAPSTPAPRRTPLLEANTPTDAPGAGPEDLEGTPASPQRPSVTTPPPVKPLGLPADAGPTVGGRSPSPAFDEGAARTRITPPAPKPEAPSPVAPRRLIAQPGGGIAPEPYPLGSGAPPPPQLESRTGPRAPSARPSLLRNLRREAGAAGVARTMESEMATRTSQEKLAQTPEGLPEQAAVETQAAAPKKRSILNMAPSRVDYGDYSLNEPTKVYHGTSAENVSDIEKKGLLRGGGFGQDRPVFVTPDEELAQQFATHRGRMTIEDKGGAVYSTNLPRKTVVGIDSPEHGGPADASPGKPTAGMTVYKDIRPSLLQRVPHKPTAEAPYTPKALAAPARLPNPTDIDGWERLVDEGHARYNTATHQYDYIGPITRRKLTR